MKQKKRLVILFLHAPASCSQSQKQVWPTKGWISKKKLNIINFHVLELPCPSAHIQDRTTHPTRFEFHDYSPEITTHLKIQLITIFQDWLNFLVRKANLVRKAGPQSTNHEVRKAKSSQSEWFVKPGTTVYTRMYPHVSRSMSVFRLADFATPPRNNLDK
jgi:hypothetical protein